MPKYSDRAGQLARIEAGGPVEPARDAGQLGPKRHLSSRPPAARIASAQSGHQGTADFAMGSTTSTRVPRECAASSSRSSADRTSSGNSLTV